MPDLAARLLAKHNQTANPNHLHLEHHLSPGDVLAMTAAVESLHRKYPGQYKTSVATTCMDIWRNNSRITPKAPDATTIKMEYPAIHQCGQRSVHFMQGFCEFLADRIGRPVPLLVNRPVLHLDRNEIYTRLTGTEDIGPYVVVNAGRKSDFTAKWAGSWIWQRVVGHFRGCVEFVQVGEGHHHHPALDGAVNLIGQTTPRQLFQLTKHAVAAAGPVSFLLHVSAALNVPYVCLAGGREEPSWAAYNSTIYLHTLGQLTCCRERACWKSHAVPAEGRKGSVCEFPVLQPDGEQIPKCLATIGECGVIEALERVLCGSGL